jgi:diguanylate cyclase (GGDEF)-like protein
VGNSPSDWLDKVHPDDLEQLQVALAAHLRGLTEHLEKEYRMLHRDGTYRWVLTRGLLVRNPEGVAYRVVGSQTDIDARKKAEEQLLHDVVHDALTGLPNRTLFLDRLSQVLERANRSAEYTFAVLFLDLDQFKVINDSLGHNAGDELLVAIGQLFRRSLRSTDTVARLGGDEFVILLDDLHDPNEAVRVAMRIQDALKAPFQVQGQFAYTSASIGIVSSVHGYERTMDILRDADIAMYQAKAMGKACYAVFEPSMRKSAIARLELESDLRQAIERQELDLYYQPILAMASGQVAGMEALLRWHHPIHGSIAPDDFIPLAEETGLIIPIGQWVLREACRQMRCWRTTLPGSEKLYVSVNVSGKQLTHCGFARQVAEILSDTGIPAHSLRLEITESVLMDNAELAMRAVEKLRALGVELYIDDFGTGYSSLSYIQRFAINTIKIDRSFVEVINDQGDSSELIKSILRFALDLGLETIAEGVETEDQLEHLKGLLCVYGQGFVISKPLSPEAAGMFLAQAFSEKHRGSTAPIALLQSSSDGCEGGERENGTPRAACP